MWPRFLEVVKIGASADSIATMPCRRKPVTTQDLAPGWTELLHVNGSQLSAQDFCCAFKLEGNMETVGVPAD